MILLRLARTWHGMTVLALATAWRTENETGVEDRTTMFGIRRSVIDDGGR